MAKKQLSAEELLEKKTKIALGEEKPDHEVRIVVPDINPPVKEQFGPCKSVVHASLHQPIVWGPAGINTEKTLSPTKTPGIKMYWCEHGLLLEKNGKTSLVPAPNVAIAMFE